VVSFKPHPSYPRNRCPRRLGEPLNQYGEEKYLLTLLEIEPTFLDHITQRLTSKTFKTLHETDDERKDNYTGKQKGLG
jgi:predicted esterase YcpF (UPF0227 family)